MTARAAMHRADNEIARLKLIIQQKDQIIQSLRNQLDRNEEIHQQLQAWWEKQRAQEG